MSESQSLGQTGENKAADYLKEKGYTIRHRNWTSGRKELDIVAENSEFIVFVEVKTRTEGFEIEPRKIVLNEKQQLIIHAADAYIKKYCIDKESRFDIIIVKAKGETFKIDHIEEAYYPTLR